MGKLIKIILWIVVLALVYLACSSLFRSCNSSASDGIETMTEAVGDVAEGTTDMVTDVGEELFEDDDDEEIDYSDDENDTSEEIIEEEIIEDDPIEETPRYNNTGSSSGQYMVIAGNYLVESNGREMIKKLKNLGYGSADLAIFDNSQYHTVIASRYSDYNEALRSESNLKAKGIDCYVKRKS